MTLLFDGVVCSTCDKPATHWARDIRRKPTTDSLYKEYEPVGEGRYGCDDHPVQSVTYGDD